MAGTSVRAETALREAYDSERPVPAPRRRGPKTRRLPYLTAGGLLVIVCVLTFAYTASRLGDRISVLAVARPVPAGQPIAVADLKLVPAADDGQLGLIPAAQATRVIGRTAVVPLVPGELLTHGLLGQTSFPPSGKVAASLALKPGQYPQGISAGARAAVFISPTGAALPGAGSPPSVGSQVRMSAVVLGVDLAGDGQGATVVTLLLDSGDAPRLAAAAAGAVVLMQTSPDGG
jgi:hypothetical protein